MDKVLTIQIPYELAKHAVWQRNLVRRYHTNALIKALDTWLVLKAETQSGIIQDWNKQKRHLIELCKVSESILRCRLSMLRDLKLLQYNRHDVKLCSWQDLARILQIDVTLKFSIQYEKTNNARVQEWILATELKENQSRQAYKVMQKVYKNPALKLSLTTAIMKAGADRSKMNDPAYFLSWLNILYRADFRQASDIHELLILVRPDCNRGVKSIADAWKAKCKTTVSYWKKVLRSSGIIDIAHLQIKSEGRVRNAACKVLWLKESKTTLLCLCDQITILQPWIIRKDNTYNTNFSIDRLSA